jgi:cytoskeletal protein CcmA (bactofilin family)
MAEPSVIGPDVTVVGTLESSGAVTVEGKVRGDINAKGNVTVSAQGRVEGNLHAKEATLRGHLLGNIRADRVVLCASCNVKGDVVHARIVIEEGATFEGNCRPSAGSSAQGSADQ